MTVGHWTDQASASLRAAADAMAGRDVVHADAALGVIHARRDAYAGLAHLAELLVGDRPLRPEPTRADAGAVLRDHSRTHLSRMRVGLYAATVIDGPPYPPADAPRTPVDQAMRRVADAVGVAGDIIASHIQPGQRPRTPEGVAIRAGGGVRAALADVGRLTRQLLAVDAKLPGWLRRADPHDLGRFGPPAAAARWATRSRLRVVAEQVIEDGAGLEPLLRLLDAAPASRGTVPAVETADQAVAALATARTWLWQHPDQVQAEHLLLATQLGLAVHTIAGAHTTGDPVVQLREWRRAAKALADLHGAPTAAPGRPAAAELAETLRWTRDRLHPRDGEPAGQRVDQVARLHADLPLLAEALHRAVPHTVARGELFRGEPDLHKPLGKQLFYARTNWTAITQPNAATRALERAFTELEPLDDLGALRSLQARAGQAFPRPPRPSAGAPGPATPLGPGVDGTPGQVVPRGR
ncbi:hypothetical protein ACFFX1_11040 [Dactylosporangium sucinum]|uniref:Uncharacterized protein n=1 Tax=Dactylosporangium sucinum TaxID=1424081 RepID=A0A917TGQ2_9ACTN|nr:hypothetical protein [Dactylosporangium sucinum]GGM22577.1 hypothetical protein GCM10007977_024690 [Dactylosporangium sucinum]